MNAFDRFFHGEHGASRSYLFSKGFLLLLALDTWMLMIGHAGRYGVASFNVAHFAWLDALLPMPTAGFYVGVLLSTGLLSLIVMLTGIRRSTGLSLFVLYTLSWAMSMLDSYQHHYLVSLVLFCLAFFPSTSAAELHPLRGARAAEHAQVEAQQLGGWLYFGAALASVAVWWVVDRSGHTWAAFFLLAGGLATATYVYQPERREPLLTSDFGFALLGATLSIVYAYTAIAKMDANWLAGHTMLRISSVEKTFAGLAQLAAGMGIERERFWSLFATMVIPQELFMAFAYLVAVQQDRLRSGFVRAVCLLAVVLAIALHVGAEAMGLQIGWFSYYMLLAGTCFLLPLTAVDRLVTVLTWPARVMHARFAAWRARSKPGLAQAALLALLGAAALALAGMLIDLPGALETGALAGALLVVVTLVLRVRKGVDPRPHVLATAVAAGLMWLAIAVSPVRWDFYRFLGGDLTRRDELPAALEAYRRGERYAPPGETRADKIADIEQRLKQGDQK